MENKAEVIIRALMVPLILYDIPSKLEGNYWSPSTAKPRRMNPSLVSSDSSIIRRVEWVEYSDIASRMKQIGARKNKFLYGGEGYTLPVLHDPNTSALITDSWEIAEYLEKTYPEKLIFPNKSKGLIRAFDAAVANSLRAVFKFPIFRTSEILSERSAEYPHHHERKRPKCDEHWAILERVFDTSKEWYDDQEGKWLTGDTSSYADIITAADLFWFKRVLHGNEWEKIANWHDGRWAKLLTNVETECNAV
ncbi:hypothetical protein EDD16DRAFT_1725797 [Pisolithus croceorrhizus]|nr:hypothetical protein EDD16DRAFT_1725797 [Pisolithus croceorrhizus]KAI6133675.1 hypothetical protein EV401DRAFT_2096126 [Pisolithus croceorrhizus]